MLFWTLVSFQLPDSPDLWTCLNKILQAGIQLLDTDVQKLRLIFLTSLNFADSAQTEYCTTFHCSSVRPSVCPCVTGVTSHISHIYKGINAMWIIRGPIKPCIFWIKIILAFFLSSKDQTRQDHLLRPDQPYHWLWLWIIKIINAESAVFTLSCLLQYSGWRAF